MHAECGSILVHYIGEHGFRAGNVLGQCNTCVITGLHDHAEQQVLHGDSRADFDEHPGALCTPGFFTDGDLVVKRYLLLLQRPEYCIR